MNEAERMLTERNLQTCLDLWLAAIKRGEYEVAKKILLEWRPALRAKLQVSR